MVYSPTVMGYNNYSKDSHLIIYACSKSQVWIPGMAVNGWVYWQYLALGIC